MIKLQRIARIAPPRPAIRRWTPWLLHHTQSDPVRPAALPRAGTLARAVTRRWSEEAARAFAVLHLAAPSPHALLPPLRLAYRVRRVQEFADEVPATAGTVISPTRPAASATPQAMPRAAVSAHVEPEPLEPPAPEIAPAESPPAESLAAELAPTGLEPTAAAPAIQPAAPESTEIEGPAARAAATPQTQTPEVSEVVAWAPASAVRPWSLAISRPGLQVTHTVPLPAVAPRAARAVAQPALQVARPLVAAHITSGAEERVPTPEPAAQPTARARVIPAAQPALPAPQTPVRPVSTITGGAELPAAPATGGAVGHQPLTAGVIMPEALPGSLTEGVPITPAVPEALWPGALAGRPPSAVLFAARAATEGSGTATTEPGEASGLAAVTVTRRAALPVSHRPGEATLPPIARAAPAGVTVPGRQPEVVVRVSPRAVPAPGVAPAPPVRGLPIATTRTAPLGAAAPGAAWPGDLALREPLTIMRPPETPAPRQARAPVETPAAARAAQTVVRAIRTLPPSPPGIAAAPQPLVPPEARAVERMRATAATTGPAAMPAETAPATRIALTGEVIGAASLAAGPVEAPAAVEPEFATAVRPVHAPVAPVDLRPGALALRAALPILAHAAVAPESGTSAAVAPGEWVAPFLVSRAAPLPVMRTARAATARTGAPLHPALVAGATRPGKAASPAGAATPVVRSTGAPPDRRAAPKAGLGLLPGTLAQRPALPVSLVQAASAGAAAFAATVVSAAPLPVSDLAAAAEPQPLAARVIEPPEASSPALIGRTRVPGAPVPAREAQRAAPAGAVAAPPQPAPEQPGAQAPQGTVDRAGPGPAPALPTEAAPGEHVPGIAVPRPGVAPPEERAAAPAVAATAAPPPAPILVPATVSREWPAIEVLQRLASPPSPGEPAALQHLRRMPMAQTRPAMQALATLPALGPGEPLPTAVRVPMETLRGHDLSAVRVHTSAAAQPLGAAAFTSGEHIVFAPGRFDVGTPQGLALLGHELAHVGQPLAFKTEPGAGPAIEDTGEREALQQELIVQRLEVGGRTETRAVPPEVRRLVAPKTLAPAAPVVLGESMVSGGIGSPNLIYQQATLGESGGVQVQRTLVPGTGAEMPQRGPFAEQTPGQVQPETERAAQAPPDIKGLAKKVYALLKARLRAEHDRHGFYR